MSPRTIEPPTVVTRPPLAATPDLPASPPPSRHGHTPSSDRETRDASQESRKKEQNGTGRPASCDAGERSASEDRDNEGRLKRRKQGREGRRARWRQLAEDWKLWMTLENSGSVARDHLASERTFLAYARTSLTIAYCALSSPCSAGAAVHAICGDRHEGTAVRAATRGGHDCARDVHPRRGGPALLPRAGRAHPRGVSCRAHKRERDVVRLARDNSRRPRRYPCGEVARCSQHRASLAIGWRA